MKIHLICKNVYGREMLYPNCEKSNIFAGWLLGRKTLTREHLKHIQKLGFEIELEGYVPK